jgi:hypothetical protein
MANKNEKNNRDANASFAEKVTFPPIEKPRKIGYTNAIVCFGGKNHHD